MMVCLDCWELGSRDERMEGLQLKVHDTHEVFPSSRKVNYRNSGSSAKCISHRDVKGSIPTASQQVAVVPLYRCHLWIVIDRMDVLPRYHADKIWAIHRVHSVPVCARITAGEQLLSRCGAGSGKCSPLHAMGHVFRDACTLKWGYTEMGLWFYCQWQMVFFGGGGK